MYDPLPSAELPDSTIRFRVRTLLLVTTVVAVVLAIAAPYLRNFSATRLTNLGISVGSIVITTIASVLYNRSNRSEITENYPEAKYIVAQVFGVFRTLLGALGVLAMCAYVMVILLARNPHNHQLVMAIFGMQLGLVLGGYIHGSLFYTTLQDSGLILNGGIKIPWAYVRGIHSDHRRGVFRLRRLDGDIYIRIPETQRAEVLAYLEEKTGHSLTTP